MIVYLETYHNSNYKLLENGLRNFCIYTEPIELSNHGYKTELFNDYDCKYWIDLNRAYIRKGSKIEIYIKENLERIRRTKLERIING